MGALSSPRMVRVALAGHFWPLLFLISVPAQVLAQGQGEAACDVPSHGGMVMTTLSNDTRMFFFTAPTIRCPGGVRIRADSARVYESTNYNQLWGDVVFWDQDSRLSADQAQYFSEQRRLVAQGNAVLTDLAEGSVIRGDNMTLMREGPQREEDFLTVGGRRPHATLYPSRASQVEPSAADTAASGAAGAAADTAGVAPDSAAILPDTAVVAADTAGVTPDSAAVLPDTAVVAADTAGVAPDSAAVLPAVATDSTNLVPEPVAAVPDSAGTPADSAEGPPPTPETGQGLAQETPEPEADRVPYEIDATRFVLEGSRYFRAAGSVVVTRDSLRAEADSLEYDQDEGAIFLSDQARVNTAQTDLAARAIRLDIPQDEIREALATGEAVLEGEDLRLLAPIITLFFAQGVMERLVAVRDLVADSAFAELDEEEKDRERLLRGAPPLAARELGFTEFPRRPYALAQDFILEGDSLEVIAPGEILEEVRAMGNARGESTGADSLNTEDTPELISRNWLVGDTILALFREPGDTLDLVEEFPPAEEPPPEVEREEIDADTTAGDYQLRRLIARVGARSMYRMAASDSTVAAEPGRFAVHYVVGDEITILLNPEGEAEKMEVVGQTRGIHLEPLVRRADSLRGDTMALPDTLAVPDTLVAPDTSGIRRPGRASGGGKGG